MGKYAGDGDGGTVLAPPASGTSAFLRLPLIFSAGTWTHIAAAYDRASGEARLYVNGVLSASEKIGSFVLATNYDVYFGGTAANTPTNWWFALYDDSATPALLRQTADQTSTAWAANTAKTVAADSPANYLAQYSQSTDPAGLSGYATKRLSSPPVPAATGSNLTLAAALGGFKNQNTTTISRVLTLQALDPLPAGASPLTVTVALAADPVTGRQPLTGVTFSALDGSDAGPTATLTAGAKRQLNLTIRTQPNNVFPGNNVLHTPTVTLQVTYPGYTGSFLSYVVPVTVWDGNGAGP